MLKLILILDEERVLPRMRKDGRKFDGQKKKGHQEGMQEFKVEGCMAQKRL